VESNRRRQFDAKLTKKEATLVTENGQAKKGKAKSY